tara:strand:+ start:6421 stop:6660 length:240 start_codon:yes stop_codon:yes gene_type:complete
MLNDILENYPDEQFLIADGFDDAIIGLEDYSQRLIYSMKECLRILEQDMTAEEALEHFDYNVRGAYVGEQTPIWCNDLM